MSSVAEGIGEVRAERGLRIDRFFVARDRLGRLIDVIYLWHEEVLTFVPFGAGGSGSCVPESIIFVYRSSRSFRELTFLLWCGREFGVGL